MDRWLISLAGATFLLLAQSVAAHPISLSSATVDVREDVIRVEMQIMLEDLVLYHSLSVGADHRYAAKDLKNAAEAHRDFVIRYFSIRDSMGRLIPGTVKRLDSSKIAAGGVAQSDVMSNWVLYELEYPTERAQPFLTFLQTFGGPQAVLPAVMDLMVLQNGILLQKPLQLSQGQPHTAKFDWRNPPTKSPKGLLGLRKQIEQRRRERLGISSYGGLYSFIYLTPHEVRHEILVPLLTLERWLPIERSDPDYLDVREQSAHRDAIAKFFQGRNPVRINGRPVQAKLVRMNFFGLNINDFARNAQPRRVSVYQARVGLILSYQPTQPVTRLAMKWETFNDFAPFLRSVVLIGRRGPAEHFFRPQEPTFQWSGELAIPAVNPVKGTTTQITQQAGKTVVSRLLANIYGAFGFHRDSDVYDALATSVSGDLLRDLYLQIKQSLVMGEQGGAISQVDDVTVVSCRLLDVGGNDLKTRCRWRVTGTVEHWGHVHARQNEYEALLTLRCAAGQWKIQAMQVLSEQRVKFNTDLRGDRN